MKIQLSFPEVQKVIKNKTGKDIAMRMVSDDTIGITYTISIKVPLIGKIEKNVNLDVSIKGIKGTDVYMSYDCSGIGMGMIIAGALKMLKEDPRLNFIESGEDKQIILKLGEMEKIRSIFDKVDIQSIKIADSGIETICKLKNIL